MGGGKMDEKYWWVPLILSGFALVIAALNTINSTLTKLLS